MADESYSFTAARARLEEIVAQVRKKDTSLEKSLDLLEEGVRLANVCTEQIDHADWVADSAEAPDADAAVPAAEPVDPAADRGEALVDTVAVVEDVIVVDSDGEVVAEMVEVTEYGVADEGAVAAPGRPEDGSVGDAAGNADGDVGDDLRE